MASNIQGHGAPTKKTPGVIGQTYTDLDTKQVWVCTDVKHTMDPASLKMISQYAWKQDASGGGTTKTKLSEFENDLFYTKKELFLELKTEDFTPWENPDGVTEYLYIGTPKLDWMTSKDFIAYECSWIEEGETYSYTSEEEEWIEFDKEITDDGQPAYWYGPDAPFNISSGFDYKNWDEYLSKDEFVVLAHLGEFITSINIKLYKVDSKKVPIEFCDTTEIEEQIDELINEVYEL